MPRPTPPWLRTFADTALAPLTARIRHYTAIALVVAPALFLLDNLLHPEEYTRGHEAQQLEAIADSATRWQLAHALGFLAIVVLMAAVVGLTLLTLRDSPRFALAGGALSLVGLLGFAAAITIDGYTWGVLGEVSGRVAADPETMRLTLREVQESSWSYLYYLTPVGFILGMVVLLVTAVRAGLTPPWAGGLFITGILMAGTETTIVSNAYFIAGGVVLLAGGAAVARSLAPAAKAR